MDALKLDTDLLYAKILSFEERIRYTTDETSVHGISELYTSIPSSFPIVIS